MTTEQNEGNPKKKLWRLSNLITLILLVIVVALWVSPAFKGMVTGALMKIGLFQPKIEKPENAASLDVATENLALLDQDGNKIDLSELKGKVVFMNFWATWCPPCRAEMPSINTLYNELKEQKDIVFLIVDIDNQMEKSLKYMQDSKFQLPVHVATTNIPTSYLGQSVPTTVVLDKKGAIVYRHEGMADYNSTEFKNYMKELMNQ